MKTKLLMLLLTAICLSAGAQQKSITHNTHTWVSINSNWFVSKHIFIMADVHVRENNFFASNSFLFGRVGIGYQLDDKLSFAAGYGNMLVAPTVKGWTTKADEERLFQQVQLLTSYKKIKLLQRLRNEQRWQDIIVNDQKTGKTKFSNRVRYLLSTTIPVFKNPHYPQLMIADELLLQFGKDIVYNTFDQNRFFVGVKQSITKNLSFDCGYMKVFQQKSSGSGYNSNDTFRLFFYYTLPHHTKQHA